MVPKIKKWGFAKSRIPGISSQVAHRNVVSPVAIKISGDAFFQKLLSDNGDSRRNERNERNLGGNPKRKKRRVWYPNLSRPAKKKHGTLSKFGLFLIGGIWYL